MRFSSSALNFSDKLYLIIIILTKDTRSLVCTLKSLFPLNHRLCLVTRLTVFFLAPIFLMPDQDARLKACDQKFGILEVYT